MEKLRCVTQVDIRLCLQAEEVGWASRSKMPACHILHVACSHYQFCRVVDNGYVCVVLLKPVAESVRVNLILGLGGE